jgi:xanthine dehydrogenase accessory factor
VTEVAGLTVLVRGVGDVGSAVARTLFLAGHRVVLHDGPEPATTRRGMAFTDAVFDGHADLAGVHAIRVSASGVTGELAAGDRIPVVVDAIQGVVRATVPDVLVDARMRKRTVPEPQQGQARLTIGLGPGFVAGQTVDVIVETAWGEDLGRWSTVGMTQPLAGEPRPIAGYGRERFVYAPLGGRFTTTHVLGDLVAAGETVAWIEGVALVAPISGLVRGLTHSGVLVTSSTKVIEVDPRGAGVSFTGVGERPGRIAAGVLDAIRCWHAETSEPNRTRPWH